MAIRKISQICRYLDEATTLRLVHASSLLDLIPAIHLCMDSLIKILLKFNVYRTLLLASFLACLVLTILHLY